MSQFMGACKIRGFNTMLIALIMATFTDIKRREIPIWIFPTLSVLFIILNFSQMNWKESFVGFSLAFLSFLFLAIFFEGGGGDIIMMSCMGFILGIKNITYIIIFSSMLCILYYFITKKNDSPYAPFALGGYLITGGLLYAFNDFGNVVWHYILL
jgi:leader peptidase (prepilin peptidase)/N-methyltransferase